MNTAKKLMFGLLAGATLGIASPVFADSYHHDRYDRYDRHYHRDFDRHYYGPRVYAPRPVVVERPYYVGRPVVVEQPVYYGAPAPAMGPGAVIGQAIGTIIDYTR